MYEMETQFIEVANWIQMRCKAPWDEIATNLNYDFVGEGVDKYVLVVLLSMAGMPKDTRDTHLSHIVKSANLSK